MIMCWQLLRRVPVLLALLPLAQTAFATNTVWVSSGDERGQGAVFQLAGHCYAVTAGHVVKQRQASLLLVDHARSSAQARVVTIDEKLDLALLEIPDIRAAGRALCTRKPTEVPVWPPGLALAVPPASVNAWLSKVNSASGELTRFNMALPKQAPGNRIRTARLETVFGRQDPQPGDSGAPLWMTEPARRIAPQSLYKADGTPLTNRPIPRALLGIYLGRSGEEAVLVSGEAVRNFVLHSLERIEPSRITLQPPAVTLVRWARGSLPTSAKDQLPAIDDTALGTLSIELDLGRRETMISSVSVGGGAPEGPSVLAALGGRQRLTVHSSAYRPGEASATWTKERCGNERTRLPPGSARCVFNSPKVVRGLRLEISGSPSMVNSIDVGVHER